MSYNHVEDDDEQSMICNVCPITFAVEEYTFEPTVEQSRPENGKMKCFHYYNYYYYNRTQHSNPLRQMYCVFETLTNK